MRKIYVPLDEADRERLGRLAEARDEHPSQRAKRLLSQAIRAADRRASVRTRPAGRGDAA